MLKNFKFPFILSFIFLLNVVGTSNRDCQFILQNSDFVYETFKEIYGIDVKDRVPIYLVHRIDNFKGVTPTTYAGFVVSKNEKYIIVRPKAKNNLYVLHHEIFHYLIHSDCRLQQFIDQIDYTKYENSKEYKNNYSLFDIRELFYIYKIFPTVIDTADTRRFISDENSISVLYQNTQIKEETFIRILMQNFIYSKHYMNGNYKFSNENKKFNLAVCINVITNYNYRKFYNENAKSFFSKF
jgi:hypothetical protein